MSQRAVRAYLNTLLSGNVAGLTFYPAVPQSFAAADTCLIADMPNTEDWIATGWKRIAWTAELLFLLFTTDTLSAQGTLDGYLQSIKAILRANKFGATITDGVSGETSQVLQLGNKIQEREASRGIVPSQLQQQSSYLAYVLDVDLTELVSA